MLEVDLLKNYPKANRNVKERGATKTEEDRAIARRFGREFFDGDRRHGYGGFQYHSRFWEHVVPTFQDFFQLTSGKSVLDVGCGKGFMLYDMQRLTPGLKIAGVDISPYAVENAMPEVKPFLKVGNATSLPFPDKSFDLIISINTVHNLDREACGTALKEMMRVSRKNAFITVDAYRNDDEKEAMFAWNLTAKTIMSTSDWISFFHEVGYTGHYYWFTP